MKQINTPEFKKWFGKSFVVDKDGNPLVVYHGTSKEFNTFNFSAGINAPVRNAVYFSNDPNVSNLFANAGYNGSGQVMPVYLKIECPLIIDAEGEHAIRLTSLVDNEMAKGCKVKEKGITYTREYDGVIIINVKEFFQDYTSTTYAVFKPTQVKSATGNSGAFSIHESDIRKNPESKPSSFYKWFKDSKVIDKAGNPLICYHGTNVKFDTFRERTQDGARVIYFTPDQNYGYIRKSENVISAYLSIQNPFYTDRTRMIEGLRTDPETVDELIQAGYDGVIYANKDNLMKGPSGYGDDRSQIAVFYPNQIKSATDNNGEYSNEQQSFYKNPSVNRLPRHLEFLEGLTGHKNNGFKFYFTKKLKRSERESFYDSGGIRYLGDNDGSMVPIEANNLEPVNENMWHGDKFSAIVDAIEAGENPIVYPGYANLDIEDGELCAQVMDGNHRTFAPIAAGSNMSWIIMSDSTKQYMNDRESGSDALYKAIRKAQKEAGVTLFNRNTITKLKSSPSMEKLIEAERVNLELRKDKAEYERKILRKYGKAERVGRTLEEQLENPQMYFRMRLGELNEKHGSSWIYNNIENTNAYRSLKEREKSNNFSDLYDLRVKAGLKHGEWFNPETGRVEKQ